MTTINDSGTAASWTQVTYFQIYKVFASASPESVGLFANGRQQCQIQVEFIARDDRGTPVTLTASDIRTHLQLIDYRSGAVIGEGATANWSVSTTGNDYEWDESVITMVRDARGETFAQSQGNASATSHPPAPANQQRVTLYVSSAVATRLQVGAKLSYPTASRPAAMTNVSSITFNDPLGNGEGQFNSMVIIDAVAGPALSTQDYGDRNPDMSLAMQPVGNENHFFRAFQCRVNVNFGRRRFPLRSVSGSKGGASGFAVYKYGSFGANWLWGMSYYAQPGAASPEHFPLPPLSYVDVETRGPTSADGVDDASANGIARLAIECITRIATRAQGDSTAARHTQRQPDAGLYTRYEPINMLRQCVGGIDSPSADSVVVGVLAGNLRGRFKTSTGLDTPEVTTTMLYLMDVYGNEHALRLAFSTQLPQLTLTKA